MQSQIQNKKLIFLIKKSTKITQIKKYDDNSHNDNTKR